MKKIEKYVTSDGAEFYNEEDALHRENLLSSIRDIESKIPTRPDSTDFTNGHGYIQHDKSRLERVLIEFYKLCLDEFPSLSEYDIKSYGFSRTLDDSGRILYNLYWRLVMCIDSDTLREYGQPYFVLHPEDADEVEIR